MRGIPRKLIKLLQMPTREIATRCTEQWYGWQERLAITGHSSAARRLSDADQSTAHFNEFLIRPFYFAPLGSQNVDEVQSFQALFPECRKNVVEQADLICCGSLRLFGTTVTFPRGQIDWHLDWQTGLRFPVEFYRSIRGSSLQTAANLKRVWEINRQQFLLTLGKAYWLTREPKYAQEIIRLIESWISSNPPYCGVNWQESLESALRLLSWTWSLRMIGDSGFLVGASLRRILVSIALQRDHIARHLSLYYSPNTHLLGEALTLFVVETSFPGLGSARLNANEALRILETELTRQVDADGSHRELSAYYHCYALEMYLLATILGRQHGVEFPQFWMQRVERMAEFLLAIVRPAGSLARFGDDDGGRTLRLNDEDYYHPRSLLAVAAVLFERGDFRQIADEPPEEVFWVYGEKGVQRFLHLDRVGIPPKQVWFPDAKIAVLRSGGGPRDAWLASVGQPMGFMGSGHSHPAFASFELDLDGRPVIVDPGTYTYASSDPWRDRFRLMEMHNVVQIDGKHYFEPEGPFGWKQTEAVEELQLGRDSSVSAQFGYRIGAQAAQPVQHVRTLRLESSRSVSVRDEFAGTGRHRLAFWLHFLPGSRLFRKSRHEFEIQTGEAVYKLVLKGFGNFECQSWDGMEDFPMGWCSPQFNVKVASLTLRVQEDVQLPAERSFSVLVVSGPDVTTLPSETDTRERENPRGMEA